MRLHRYRSPRTIALSFAVLALVLMQAPLSAQAQSTTYGLKAGDRITVEFYASSGVEVPEIAGERTIARDGSVYMPLIGRLDVTGLDATAIREALESRYEPFYSDAVIDVVAELRLSVTGAVRSPGNFFVDPTSTLVDVLAMAGGASAELSVSNINIPSDPSQVRLVRNGETQILDMRADFIDPSVATMRVESGDWLYVPPRERSRIRDEITFWGSIIGFITSIFVLIQVSN